MIEGWTPAAMSISPAMAISPIAINIDTLAVVACVALTAAVLIFVFMIQPDLADSAPHRSHLDQLMERRDIIYDNLRDLKFEYRTGKFAEEDYEQMKQTLEAEAAVVLAEIERVTENPAALPRSDAAARARALPAGPRAGN
jgi:K+-sensing histidine kinase KdpD